MQTRVVLADSPPVLADSPPVLVQIATFGIDDGVICIWDLARLNVLWLFIVYFVIYLATLNVALVAVWDILWYLCEITLWCFYYVYNGGFPTGEGEKIGRLLKKTRFAECRRQWLSAKRENGARPGCPLCRVHLTRHSAKKATRDAVDSILCREPEGDTRQTVRSRWRAVTATFLCRGPHLALG
jgi:hypothetical protein